MTFKKQIYSKNENFPYFLKKKNVQKVAYKGEWSCKLEASTSIHYQ